MYELKNDHLTVRFDGQGRLTWLENNRAGYGNIVAALADDSFKLVYRQGGNWENVVLGRDQQVRVVQQADRLEFWIDKARTPEAAAPESQVQPVSLAGEDLDFGAPAAAGDRAHTAEIVESMERSGGTGATILHCRKTDADTKGWYSRLGDLEKEIVLILAPRAVARRIKEDLIANFHGEGRRPIVLAKLAVNEFRKLTD